MIGLLRRILIRLIAPMSKVIGHIYLAPKHREIKAHDVQFLFDHMKPGDVLLSYTKGELTNVFIEGEFKHCAIYVGDGYVVEAIGRGVTENLLEDFCASKDKIAVCRPLFCGDDVMISACQIAMDQRGKPYDYGFEPNEQAFYCAELVAYCYNKATEGKSPFTPRSVMGVETVLPVDYKLAAKKFSLVMERPN